MIRFAPLLFLAPSPAGTGADEGAWRSLPVPSICRPVDAEPAVERLLSGWHLLPPVRDRFEPGPPPTPVLPLASLIGLVQGEAARSGTALEVQPSGPPLLARGPAEALDALAARLGALDALGRSLEVEVEAWLLAAAPPVEARPDPDLAAGLTSGPPWGSARVRSGTRAVLGARSLRDYVAGFTVEVATDSGVSDPAIGRVALGDTLHVRACRLGGGRQVHLEGFLDLAELEGLEAFDTGTADLGVVQQPTVRSAQVAFSGVVESGGWLAVSLRGAALEGGERTLLLTARTEPDPAPADWTGYDLALVSTRLEGPPALRPIEGWNDDVGEGELLLPGISPAAFAQAADRVREGGRRSASMPLWSDRFLLSVGAELGVHREVGSLLAAAERERATTHEVRLTAGELEVVLPAARGWPVRVLVGRETSRLVDYDVQVAQETWMPDPRIVRVFEGVGAQAVLYAGGLEGTGFVSRFQERAALERADVVVGRLQTLERTWNPARLFVEPGGRGNIPGSGADGIEVALSGREGR